MYIVHDFSYSFYTMEFTASMASDKFIFCVYSFTFLCKCGQNPPTNWDACYHYAICPLRPVPDFVNQLSCFCIMFFEVTSFSCPSQVPRSTLPPPKKGIIKALLRDNGR